MRVSVRACGVVADGRNLDSPAIQAAIDRCADAGGGTVLVPQGSYRCGTLRLRSGVELRLEHGAVIESSREPADFPVIAQRSPNTHPPQVQALIWLEHAQDAAITGPGVIDGMCPEPLAGPNTRRLTFRPALIVCRDCTGLRFQDVGLANSDFWTLHLLRCRRVRIEGVTIRNHLGRINADGIDPDGCEDVSIRGCRISCGDDCIVLKSTEGQVCRNIRVRDCTLATSCAAIKLGTEARGDIRDVEARDCTITRSFVALALYMKDGSTYEDVTFANMDIRGGAEFPIVLDISPRYYRTPTLGRIRNVTLRDLRITAPGRCLIEGCPQAAIENVRLENIDWTVPGPAKVRGVQKPRGSAAVEVDPAAPNHAGQPYHFVIAHARGVALRNVRVAGGPAAAFDRGLAWLHDAPDAELTDVTAPPPPPGLAAIERPAVP